LHSRALPLLRNPADHGGRCRDSGKGGVASRILVVQSYNPEYVWTQQIEKGLRDALAGWLWTSTWSTWMPSAA
jgi:hypothetical protein